MTNTILITGGAGFLGRALIRELMAPRSGQPLDFRELRVFDSALDGLDRLDSTLDRGRLVPIVGDVRSGEALRDACRGVDLVFHCAAIIDWGRYSEELLQAVNVTGTENVITACRTEGVRGLIFTSTEDVVYTGRPVRDGDETLPYPRQFANAYCRTKASAEQTVLRANGVNGAGDHPLHTVVIRPCGMFGEADPFHVSQLMRMARQGPLLRVGDGSARCQQSYVGNVAHGHLLAARRLLAGDQKVQGQIYFITDYPAANFFDFLEPVLGGCGYRIHPWRYAIPMPVMYGLGAALETAAWLVRPLFRFTPIVTRFAAEYVCHDYTFSSAKAARDLGYAPVYPLEEALAITTRWFRRHGPV